MRERFYLESSAGQDQLPRRLDLNGFPATVGRHPDCSVQLNVDRISRLHARFDLVDGELRVEDLGSTNGTFVNHEAIREPTVVAAGDVLHLADHEFRMMRDDSARTAPARPVASADTVVGMNALPRHFPLQMAAFFDLLEHERVCAYHQGIHTADGELYACELLGRSTHPELVDGPGQLFSLAAALNAEVRLSRLLRRCSFEAAHRAGLRRPLFFNNHPAECEDFDALLSELAELRARYPDLKLVFEVHEAAVTDLKVMASVREELKRMGIALAYDDFGAGQARLLELVDVPPDYLKFDISLIRGLDSRESPKYRLLSTLNGMISELGIRTLAEGIETRVTAELCREIGIDLLQGFYYSRPSLIPRRRDHHHSETESEP
ncbi:MAG: EAL domain-containing protein [Wenzhouxiangella sp.]|nr:MAG: EAL domain-containing protein [Wenzhouxiangella sp.]